jgi:glucosyl-dolichyl phosphate glucuronosyltransferase
LRRVCDAAGVNFIGKIVAEISIIICTRNRAASLGQTLAALGRVAVPAGKTVEILVVDNGSGDETAKVVADARVLNAEVRYLQEKRPGLSRARNRGLADASGDIIVFTDDDVIPAEDWLVRLCAPMLAGEADAVAGGVRIAADLERPWMTDFHRAWVAGTGLLDEREPSRMVGANMGFVRKVLNSVPAFDENLGAGALGTGDETLFSRQLKAAGFRLVGAFDAEVEHRFEPSRLEAGSWEKSARVMGQVDAYIAHHWEHADWGRPQLLAGKAALQLARSRLTKMIAGDKSPAPERYLLALRHYHACRHYLHERTQPRQYAQHGLAKLTTSGEKGDPCQGA